MHAQPRCHSLLSQCINVVVVSDFVPKNLNEWHSFSDASGEFASQVLFLSELLCFLAQTKSAANVMGVETEMDRERMLCDKRPRNIEVFYYRVLVIQQLL